jgi:Ca2+-binding EF-hand superfamily protein
MNNFLLVPDNEPSWEGFILTTPMSIEDVKKLINEFKIYCQDTNTFYGSDDFMSFLSNKGIEASVKYINKMINF